ncbi:peptide ABC transporter substrate-binding protein [Frondihabitans sp. PAMC 28766]|uniref:ABC transporter substrate-binding protein n=1 Tax=Frondihabitans sp. PAMC 28766 TaxID=1795630 RepID=UPI00078EEBFA|nr:ABC transporter substrate-binding protein [Frondihabitans sp. PAMC 28766]AMM21916.1 peptide ABC transporter substrate-binding protein [Frondihabitans sp. PAMC 28766]
MRKTKRILSAVALAAAGAIALAACSSGGSSGTSSASTFVIVTAAQPQSFSYETSATGYEAAEFFMNTGATLIRNKYVAGTGGQSEHEDYNDFTGVLAKSYDVSSDGLTYTFHLNTKAKSTSGDALNAQDVVWSMDRKFKTATSIVSFVSAPFITSPTQWKAVNDSTVTLTVAKKSYGYTALSLLSNVPYNIYDATLLKKHATASDPYAVKWSGTHANFGFGAYKLSSYTPGEQMVYTANTGYALGTPKVTRIVQRVVADAGTRANLVKSGDAQIAVQLRPADQVSLAKAKSATIFTVPTNAYVYMPLLTSSGVFKDVNVRRALAYAIPYDAIDKNVYHGRATPNSTIISSTDPGFDSSGLKANTTDPAKAKSILAAAGYKSPINFTLTVNNSVPDLDEAAVQIQTAVKAAGFNMTINQVNSSAFQAGLAAKTFAASLQRDYAVVQSPPYVLSLFYTPKSPINWPDFTNQNLISAIAAGNNAGVPTSVAAGKEWNAAQKVLQDQMPTIYINYVQPLNAFANNVKGYVYRSDNVLDYSQLSVSK